jgi:hypothetical protein
MSTKGCCLVFVSFSCYVSNPCRYRSCRIPFSHSYAINHALSSERTAILLSDKSSKIQVKEFASIAGTNNSKARLDDNLNALGNLVLRAREHASIQQFLSETLPSRKGLPFRDGHAILNTLFKSFDRLNLSHESSSGSEQIDLMKFICGTLPLWNGASYNRNVYDRNQSWVSTWELGLEANVWVNDFSPDRSMPAANALELSLRTKIDSIIEQCCNHEENVEYFLDDVSDDIAPSYSCAVPIGMSLNRIRRRLGVDGKGSTIGCFYRTVESVYADVGLILENCLLYNDPEAEVVDYASAIVNRLKEEISRVFHTHFRELQEAWKADDERRKLVMRVSRTGDNGQSADDAAALMSRGPVLSTILKPYLEPVHRDWLQTFEIAPRNQWVPQAGDRIHYCRARHSSFVNSHFANLEPSQCVVPFLVSSVGAEDKTNEPCGDSAKATAPSEVLVNGENGSDWIPATVLWTRATFPKATPKNSVAAETTFAENSILLAVGLQMSVHNLDVSVVYWRPWAKDVLNCTACGLETGSSFLRPESDYAKIHNSLDDAADFLQNADSIENCINVLKKKCILNELPSSLDTELTKASVKQGYVAKSVRASGLKSLPSFKEIFCDTTEPACPSKKGTRGVTVKVVKEKQSSIPALTEAGFLPRWMSLSLTESADNLQVDQTVSPCPKMCLELVLLRVQSGFYRHRLAVQNDVVESYVSSVGLLLSRPVTRRKSPISVKRVSRLLAKGDKAIDASDSAEPTDVVKKEEMELASRIRYIRDLHAMALLAITETNIVEVLFGLPKPNSMTVSSATTRKSAPKDPVRQEARQKLRILIDAFGRDELENTFGPVRTRFIGEKIGDGNRRVDTSLTVICDGKQVSHASYFREIEQITAKLSNGSLCCVKIRVGGKLFTQLEEFEDTDNVEEALTEEDSTEVDSSVERINETKEVNLAMESKEKVQTFDFQVKVICDDSVVSCGKNKLATASVPVTSMLTKTGLVRIVEDAMRFDGKVYERAEALVRFLFGRPNRMDACGRCQGYKRSLYVCRVKRAHSNPDFDWLQAFGNGQSVDSLLHQLQPTLYFTPGFTANDPNRNNGEHNHLESFNKQSNHKESTADDENVEDVNDPIEQLEKAKEARTLARKLLKEANIFAELPHRLSKLFVDVTFPFDPDDGRMTYCIICGLSGDLLCCDGCPNVLHSECIKLHNVPEGDWFCEECCAKRLTNEATPQELGHLPSSKGLGDLSSSMINVGAEQETSSIIAGSFGRAEFDDEKVEKLRTMLVELNASRPLKDQLKIKTEEATTREGRRRSKLSYKSKRGVEQSKKERNEVTIVGSLKRSRSPPQYRTDDESDLEESPKRKRRGARIFGTPGRSHSRARKRAKDFDDPIEALSAAAIDFLKIIRVKNAEDLLSAQTGDVANEFARWRKKEGMPVLKGTGNIATISSWKTLCRNAAIELGLDELVNIEPGAFVVRPPASSDEESDVEGNSSSRLERRSSLKGRLSLQVTSSGKGNAGHRKKIQKSVKKADKRQTRQLSNPLEALSATALAFLKSIRVNNAKDLLSAQTGDVANEFAQWRKEKGMPVLKGTGNIATISAWKTMCRNAAKELGLEELALLEPGGFVVRQSACADEEKSSSRPQSQSRLLGKRSLEDMTSDSGNSVRRKKTQKSAKKADKRQSQQQFSNPLEALNAAATQFLETMQITTVETFLSTTTSAIADEYRKWRKQQGMPVLKGSGNVATISAWKTTCRKAAKRLGMKSLAVLEPGGRTRAPSDDESSNDGSEANDDSSDEDGTVEQRNNESAVFDVEFNPSKVLLEQEPIVDTSSVDHTHAQPAVISDQITSPLEDAAVNSQASEEIGDDSKRKYDSDTKPDEPPAKRSSRVSISTTRLLRNGTKSTEESATGMVESRPQRKSARRL